MDIPITPFTNTLPIKRLGNPLGQKTKITVPYFYIKNWSFKKVGQYYTKLTDNLYKYEGVFRNFVLTYLLAILDLLQLTLDYSKEVLGYGVKNVAWQHQKPTTPCCVTTLNPSLRSKKSTNEYRSNSNKHS